jgi:hypothetical protein
MEFRFFLHRVDMRTLVLNIVLILWLASASGQGSFHYVFSVKDAKSLAPIENAHISFLPNGGNAISNKQGEVDTRLKQQVQQIKISHVQYGDTTITLSGNSNSLKLVILLTQKRNILPEANIFNGPDTIYGHPDWHVADYVFTDEGMVLLTYGHRRRFKRENEQGIDLFEECRLVWLSKLGDVAYQHPVNETCTGLHSNYPGLLFLNTRDKAFQIKANENALNLYPIEKRDFENKIRPIVGTVNPKMIGTSHSTRYPAFDVFAFESTDTAATVFAHVEDTELMTQFLSEYKWMSPRGKLEAFRYELRTGIDKEIVAGFMTGFPESIYFKPLYSPVFTTDSSVYLFDHYKDFLFTFDNTYHTVDSVKITYHKGDLGKMWEDLVMFDKATNRAFALFSKSGRYSIREINLKDGSVGPKIDITWKYPEKVSIQNGFVYYLYRPFESPQNTYLYKEPIPDLLN